MIILELRVWVWFCGSIADLSGRAFSLVRVMASSALWSVLILSAIRTIRCKLHEIQYILCIASVHSFAADVTLLSLNYTDTINAAEGENVSFVCSSGGLERPEILQIDNNIDDVRSSRIHVNGSVYQFSDIVRDDNGTLFQCFVNAVPSNYLVLIVDCT